MSITVPFVSDSLDVVVAEVVEDDDDSLKFPPEVDDKISLELNFLFLPPNKSLVTVFSISHSVCSPTMLPSSHPSLSMV